MLTAKRIYKLMKENIAIYIGAVVTTCIAAMLSMVGPIIIQITTDSVLFAKPIDGAASGFFEWLIGLAGGIGVLKQNIWMCGIALLVVTIFNGLFSFFKGKWTAAASEAMAKRIKDQLYDHIQKMPFDYHVKSKAGDLIQRCTSDVDTVRRFMAGQLIEIVRTVVVVIFAICIMLSYNIKMTLISMITVPIIFVFAYVFFKKAKATFKLVDEKEGELSTVIQENLSGVRVVRAFGRQKYEMDKYQVKNIEFRNLVQKMIQQLAWYWASSDFICFCQIFGVLVSGIYFTYNGEINLGTLILFNSYVGMLLWPIRQLGRILSDMGKMQIALTRIYEVLDTPEEKDMGAKTKPELIGDIVFDNVCFEYEKDTPILNNLSFKIKSGETIAILGTTGSGKSTLMHILLRLYDYNSGSVKINNVELKDIEKQYLRERIGIVLQEPFLYSKTIKENLRMAKFGASEEVIYDAAKTASIHDSIQEFEQGYDTVVGEKGVTLSGGQKQRVAIARTLIKNSSILIFDDSLSAVDTETDAQIRAALKEKQSNATTLIISQRITTLKEADRIFVIESGKLTESGTHDELVEKDGLYSRIWKIQTMMESDFTETIKEDGGIH